MTNRQPVPPLKLETATEKVQLAENGWISKEPVKVASANTVDDVWNFDGRAMTNEEIINALSNG